MNFPKWIHYSDVDQKIKYAAAYNDGYAQCLADIKSQLNFNKEESQWSPVQDVPAV